MGSFNVACSVSNLSIPPGEKTLFIPLVPNVFESYDDMVAAIEKPKQSRIKKKSPHLVQVTSKLIYPNCYFNPFSLPIEGVYNDYGGLENIVKTANTEAIEKFFGITIEQFMDCVTVERDWCDYFGGVHEAYHSHSELLKNYDIKFDEAFLKKLGFKEKDGWFKLEPFKFSVCIKPGGEKEHDGKKYEEENGFILSQDGSGVIHASDHSHDSKRQFYTEFHKATGWYLDVAPENQKRIDIITGLSGMFVLKEIYDTLANNISDEVNHWKASGGGRTIDARVTEKVLVELGFKKVKVATTPAYKGIQNSRKSNFYSKKGFKSQIAWEQYGSEIVFKDKRVSKKDKSSYLYNHGTHIFTVARLGEAWESATGEKLDLSKYAQEYKLDTLYDEHRNSLIQSEADKKTLESKKDKDVEMELRMLRLELLLDRMGSNGFGGYFKDWKYFRDLYKQPIIEGKLKEDFRWYVSFYMSMYSNNRIFFPAQNGEQCGNDLESKQLLEASLKIVNSRLKEYREENEELEELSP